MLEKKYVSHLISCVGKNVKILLHTRETNCEIKPPPYSVNFEEINTLYSKDFNVEQLKHVSIKDILERLIKKRYTEMRESIYLMTPLK